MQNTLILKIHKLTSLHFFSKIHLSSVPGMGHKTSPLENSGRRILNSIAVIC